VSTLSADETQRYARQLVLKGFGGAAQQKLKAARVAVVGAGALGSPVIAYLAGAGIGRITVIDDDRVSVTNLHRQVLHGTADIGRRKVESAERFVAARNPHVIVTGQAVRLHGDNADSVLAGHDVIIDGSDSYSTRRLVAASAQALGIPLVWGAVSMFDGQVTVFVPGPEMPGLADLYPEAPEDAELPSCEVVGVLGATTGVIGTLMAGEAIKVITGLGEPLVGRLLIYDGQGARFTELRYGRG
jgi:molybdopterin/thiamine biosynthesis adenylyltransferase